jgi:hypothetical protein
VVDLQSWMEVAMKERELAREIKEVLHRRLMKESIYKGLDIDTEKHVFIGCKVGRHGNSLKLIMQSAKQDIVVYLRTPIFDIGSLSGGFIDRFEKSFKGDEFVIPLKIFEIKYKTVNTHTVRQYSEEARMIKTIFPFVSYVLVLINTTIKAQRGADRIYMSSFHFDRVLSLRMQDEKRKEIEKISQTLYEEITDHIKYLTKDTFYSLRNYIMKSKG